MLVWCAQQESKLQPLSQHWFCYNLLIALELDAVLWDWRAQLLLVAPFTGDKCVLGMQMLQLAMYVQTR